MNPAANVVVALALVISAPAQADELRRNPFVRPKFEASVVATTPGAPVADEQIIRVSAILLAGDKSLVSFNGVVLGIGEEHAGYVLRAVREEEAVFIRRGTSVTVPLFDGRGETDGE